MFLLRPISAQTFVNGSFETGDFTGWQTTVSPPTDALPNGGSPSVQVSMTGAPNPIDGTHQAFINSTGTFASNTFGKDYAVDASTLQTFLNTTLPSNGNGAPFNGQAIKQTFSVENGATISFSYAYQSREDPRNGYDETGYVLNGVFHALADTLTPGQTGPDNNAFLRWKLPYKTVAITVGAGTNTLAFVTYNTGNGQAPSALFIDNVTVTPSSPDSKTTAQITLENVAQVFDGTPKPAAVDTVPANLNVTLTYDGSSTAPTEPGSYAVVGTIADAAYQGSATATMTIDKAVAALQLDGLATTYDGTPKVVTATTMPANLNVTLTYAGNAAPPTSAGSYQVAATVNDAEYQGGQQNTLVIGQATATVTLENLQQAYSGMPKSANATTDPPNLNVTFTYDGSPTPPSAPGSYAVIGTINDTNYQGSASGTMVVADGFNAWATSYSISGSPTDTPENDGVPNLLKYLHDIDPSRPMSTTDRAALPVLGITTISNAPYLTLTYRQGKQVADLTITPQSSNDLINWTPLSPVQSGADDITGDPVMQARVPYTGGKQFLRLQVIGP